jgi:hypothetical protein
MQLKLPFITDFDAACNELLDRATGIDRATCKIVRVNPVSPTTRCDVKEAIACMLSKKRTVAEVSRTEGMHGHLGGSAQAFS